MTPRDNTSQEPLPPPVPPVLKYRSSRTAMGVCFAIIVLAIIKHATLGLGYREPSVWSAMAAAAALTAALVIPWVAGRWDKRANAGDPPASSPTRTDS